MKHIKNIVFPDHSKHTLVCIKRKGLAFAHGKQARNVIDIGVREDGGGDWRGSFRIVGPRLQLPALIDLLADIG